MNHSRPFVSLRHILAAALLCSAASAYAQAPTIITTAPYTITKPGAYQLQADLVYAGNPNTTNDAIITINAGNVTLDFNGHYISGPSNNPNTPLIGVYAYERGNITLKNGTIAYCGRGVFLNGNYNDNSLNINQRMDELLVTYCYSYGVLLNNARNSDVRNCRISFIGSSSAVSAVGIACGGGTGIVLMNNTIISVTAASGSTSYGIAATTDTFSLHNRIANCQVGIYGGKYQQNLTIACKTAFANGVDANLNN